MFSSDWDAFLAGADGEGTDKGSADGDEDADAPTRNGIVYEEKITEGYACLSSVFHVRRYHLIGASACRHLERVKPSSKQDAKRSRP